MRLVTLLLLVGVLGTALILPCTAHADEVPALLRLAPQLHLASDTSDGEVDDADPPNRQVVRALRRP
ncbi:MAG: hypothetical protein R3247_06395, partial [Rhodothermales bacterium]|nr:hypothetical protein [Rhodothermales bacterium]